MKNSVLHFLLTPDLWGKRKKKEPTGSELFWKAFPDRNATDVCDSLDTDLDLENFGVRKKGVCFYTKENLTVWTVGGESKEIALSDLSACRFENGVGCVYAIAAKKDGTEFLLCGGDGKKGTRFSAFTKGLNRFLREADSENRLPAKISKTNRAVCPNCGKPIPEGSVRCPVCSSGKQMLLRLLKLSKPEWKYVAVTVVLFFLTTGLSVLSPRLSQILVDDYILAGTESVFWAGFIGILLAILGVSVFSRLIGIARGYFLCIAGNRLIVRLRKMVFEKIQLLSYNRFSKRTVGNMMQRVGGDTDRIRMFLIDQMPNLLEQMLLLAAIVFILFFYSPTVALLVLVPAPLIAYGFRQLRRFMRKLYRQRLERNDQANAVLHDIFSGIRVVKSYGMEKREEKRFTEIASSEMQSQLRQEKIWAILMPILNFLVSFGHFILLYYVGSEMLDGQMTAGQLALFSAYAGMVYTPLEMLMRLPRQLTHMVTSLSRIYEIVDEPLDLPEAEHPVALETVKGEISLEHVSFGYDGGDEVLHDINLEIHPGEFVGLVGRSGVGKSTLINLIMRMYDVEDGSIKLDGVDLRNLRNADLHDNIGAVLQETFLFAGTVWQNLTFAKKDATREEVIQAAKAAGAHDFIVRLPDGYQTYIGEKGYTLSGGERQRLAIARALLRNPRILILDEATSALDTETEKLVQDALKELTKGRTTIAIAHRLSTLRNANKLVVLDHGKVAEVGTHEELMEKNGLYAELVSAQREMTRMKSAEPTEIQ